MMLTVEFDVELAEAQARLNDYTFCTQLDVPSTANELHWHSFDAEFYITDGTLVLTDAEGNHYQCGPGSLIKVPEGTLHQEFSETGYQVVFGASVTPDQFGDPVDRPASTLA